jgi:hypothetical protein
MDSNHRPLPCQGSALDQLSYGPVLGPLYSPLLAASLNSRCIKLNAVVQLQNCAHGSENHYMPKSSQAANRSMRNPFRPGCIVVVTLGNPRDKFWGMILALAPEGLSMSGIELAGFEDFVLIVKESEQFTPAVVFFPMHRIERIELDLPDGGLPSLAQRFRTLTGRDPATLLSSDATKDFDRRTDAARSRIAAEETA